MKLFEFSELLRAHPDALVGFQLASGERLAAHFHVTEIGKVSKDFVDCGGTRRSTLACVLQTLVANDVDHRLHAGKLAGIVDHASVLDLPQDVAVEAEVQQQSISLFEVADGSLVDDTLVFRLAPKQTACLAPDKCGLELEVLSGGDAGG